MPNDPMEATFIGFRMWVAAVEKRRHHRSCSGARGACRHDRAMRQAVSRCGSMRENQHLHKPAFIGRITDEGAILPVWTSPGLVPPEPWSPWLKGEGLRKAS